MQITKIVVHAGRTFNHPHEEYSNLRPQVTLEAQLAASDDAAAAVKALQAQAEGLVEDHKQNMLRSIEELYQLGQKREEMIGLQRQLQRAQSRLDEIRKEHPQLALGNGAEQTESSFGAENE